MWCQVDDSGARHTHKSPGARRDGVPGPEPATGMTRCCAPRRADWAIQPALRENYRSTGPTPSASSRS